MESELQRYITAARQMGEVTGEDLLEGLAISPRSISVRTRVPPWAIMGDKDLLSILRDRVWEVVREWQKEAKCAVAWYGTNWVDILGGEEHHTKGYPDLPTAAAAIYKHHTESRQCPHQE